MGLLQRLQAVAGNAAIQGLLEQPVRAPQPRSDGPTRRLSVQRDVGFEFETGWYVSHADGSPFEKYDPLFTGAGWQMEADEPSEGRSDIEFVVKPPFPETAPGRAQLQNIVPAAATHFTNMHAAAGGGLQPMQGAQANPFVDNALANDVQFQPSDDSATPQTTVGVRLDRLVTLLNELARPQGDAQAELLGLGGHAPHNTSLITAVTDVVQGTPATWALHDHNRPAYHPSDAMKGLVSLLLLYLRRGAVIPGSDLYAQAFKYAKVIAIIMGRTDFSGMFRLLPDQEKDYYRVHPDHWVQFVLDAAADSYPAANFAPNGNVIARGLKETAPKLKKNGQVRKAGTVRPIPVTRQEWLTALLVGHDLLNVDTFHRYKPKLKKKVQFSGSFGSLGHKTDDVGALAAHKGVVLELREVKDGLRARDWGQFAEDVFDYIVLLNAWGGGAGPAPQYQKRATPATGQIRH